MKIIIYYLNCSHVAPLFCRKYLLFDTTGPLLAKLVSGTDVPAAVSSVESTVGNGRAEITIGACSRTPTCRELDDIDPPEVVSAVEKNRVCGWPCAADLLRRPSLLAWRCDLRIAAAAAKCCMIRSSISASSASMGTWEKQ